MTYFISVAIIGFLGLTVSWFPYLMRKINISYSLLPLILGFLTYHFFDFLPWKTPFHDNTLTIHFTEILVIIALMGAGLKIDRRFSFSKWKTPNRLVMILMLLSFLTISLIGFYFLGLSLASAVLLGAVLSPTDPVLASDIQSGPPQSNDENNVRFSLTAEAGLNDGMAFPLTWLAVSLASTKEFGLSDFSNWFAMDVVWRIFCGVAVGYLIGRLTSYFFLKIPEKHKVHKVQDGIVALSACFLTYGLSEILHGYGFIAVFVSAITIRNYEFEHKYHQKLHYFISQVERILLALLLFLFGGSLTTGILGALTIPMAVASILFVILIRPIIGYLSLIGLKLNQKEKGAISFFGVKGVGSFFYLSFALGETYFKDVNELWAITSFTVLTSLILHGISSIPVMKKLELDD